MTGRVKNILFIMCDQLRFDYLSCAGHPHLADAAHRCAGGARRALHARLCAVADLRRLAHELLYRPLRAVARRDLERLSAQGRRDDASAIICARSACDTVLVGKTHMQRRHARAWSGSASIRTRSSACASRNAASIRTSATTACTRIGPDGRYDPRLPRYNGYLNDKGYPRRQSLARLRQCRGGRGQHARLGLGDAPCAQARARAGGGFRDAVHDAARDRLHAEAGDAAVVPASLLHQAALALYRAGALQRHVRPDDVIPAVRCGGGARRSASGLSRIHATTGSAAAFSRDEVRDEVIPVYMGLIKQIDDQLGVLFDFMQERGLMRQHDDRVHLRSRRLSRRSLARREGAVPRAVGEGAADHLRPVRRGRRGARHGVRRTGRGDRPRCRPSSRRSAPIRREQSHRLEGRSLLPLLRGETPAAWRRYRDQRIRLFDAAGAAMRSASRRAMRACSWSPTSAGNTSTRSASGRCCSISRTIPRSCAISAPIRPIEAERAAACGRAGAMGPAAVAADHAVGRQIRGMRGKVAAARHPDRRVGRKRHSRGTVEQRIAARRCLHRRTRSAASKERLPGEDAPSHARPSRPARGRDRRCTIAVLAVARHRSASSRSASSSRSRPAARATALARLIAEQDARRAQPSGDRREPHRRGRTASACRR